MKLFKTRFIIALFILFTVFVSNLFAQDRYVNPFDGSDVPLTDEPNSNVTEVDVTTFKGNTEITDEYGSNHVNRACYFGSGSTTRRVQVPYNSIFRDQSLDGSIEMWVYPTSVSSTMGLFSMGGSSSSTVNYYLGYSPSNPTVRLFFRIGGTGAGFFHSGTVLTVNTWQHIAVTWHNVGGGNYEVRFYKNGSQVAVRTQSATWNNSGSYPVIIGGINTSTSYYMRGYIDEVRFWGTERTSAQIRDNRFVGIGDLGAANTGNALTSSTHYAGCLASWTFNFSSSTAYDDIGGHDGTYEGGCYASTMLAGQPIPYNLALKCDGSGTNSYVKIPHNTSVFNQTSDGSIEAWVYLNSTGFNPVFQKGSSGNTTTFAFGISGSNKLFLRVGSYHYHSNGVTFATGKWYHVAATWTGGSNRTVRLYVNGNLDYTQTYNIAMPTNTVDAVIGAYSYSSSRFRGYIDEVRIWNPRLTDKQIRENMLVSGRELLPNSQLVGCWNFDGNLGNWSAVTGVNGSFNTGSGNDCRLSGYSNETSAGAYNYTYDAHTTVLYDSYLNNAYFKGKTGKLLPNLGYVYDTITVTKWPGNVTNVRVLISLQHQRCDNIEIRLYAPNMQYRTISFDNGGESDNGYLTIFYDGHSQPVTSTSFLSPWSNYVKPENTMGNFGNSPVNGRWILRVRDFVNDLNSGTLMGWGLRFNNSTTSVSPISSNIPEEYKLHQNYPNPFNPVTNIKFEIPKDGIISIKVYDILGREINTLVNQSMKVGSYNVKFDASGYSSGTYFYKIQAGDFKDIKKMLLIK